MAISTRDFFDRQMIDFIISFISADIAIMLVQAMSVWLLYKEIGIEYITVITLISLFLNAIISKKIGLMLDKHSRVYSIVLANIAMSCIITIALITQNSLYYILLSLLTGVYFSIFYSARSAVAQAISIKNYDNQFKRLNSVLMITDKVGAVLVGMAIASLFALLQAKYLVLLSLLILVASTFLLIRFKKYESTNIDKVQKEISLAMPKNFGWFFSHRIAFVATCALVVTVAIMIRNTINDVYLYDVLKLTPDLISYMSILYNAAAIFGGVVVNWIYKEKLTIYFCIGLSLLMSFFVALQPTFHVFLISSLVFGLLNSINRVMYDSLIMKCIDNNEVGTFYGFLNAINQSSQFIILIAINIFIWFAKNNSSENSTIVNFIVLFYPLIFLLIPIFFIFSKIFIRKS